MERFEGVVKFYNETKGFGFVVPKKKDGTVDLADKNAGIFLHVSGFRDVPALREGEQATLLENDVISFEKKEGQKGEMAVEIDLIQRGSHAA